MAKEVTNTFWGVTLNAGKKYSQTLNAAVHVSMAALEPGSNNGDDGAVSVMIQHKKSDFVLCSLSGRHVFQQSLDLNFNEGEEVTFYLKGKGKVHLTGSLISIDNYDSSSDADFQPQSSFHESESADDDDDDDDDDDTSSDEDADHSEGAKKRKKLLATLKQSKKPKVEIVDDDEDDEDEEIETDDEDDDDKAPKRENAEKKRKTLAPLSVKQSKETKNGKQKETGKGVNSASTVSESNQSESNEKKKKKKKKNKKKKNELTSSDSTNLPTDKQVDAKSRIVEGVTIEEVKIGHGPEAKKGSTVHLYYTGKLPDGKLFDSRTSGKTFKFNLGKKEVISGWEVGVEGMKVGGKRKLVIPPKMGYGSQNVGGGNIPPNSTLHFEVELKAVN